MVFLPAIVHRVCQVVRDRIRPLLLPVAQRSSIPAGVGPFSFSQTLQF